MNTQPASLTTMERLKSAGLRPTRQRVALAGLRVDGAYR